MTDQSKPPNLFFRGVIIAGALFVVTVMAMIATAFGDQRAPLAKLMNEYSLLLIAGETVVILVIGTLAMTVDRRQSLQEIEHKLAERHFPTEQLETPAIEDKELPPNKQN